jgi:hypothetical protein
MRRLCRSMRRDTGRGAGGLDATAHGRVRPVTRRERTWPRSGVRYAPRCKSDGAYWRVARDSAAQYPSRPARTPPIPQAAICPGSSCTAAYTAAPALKAARRIETPPRR